MIIIVKNISIFPSATNSVFNFLLNSYIQYPYYIRKGNIFTFFLVLIYFISCMCFLLFDYIPWKHSNTTLSLSGYVKI